MVVKCVECGSIAESNDSIFFDVSTSDTGLDIDREDAVVCISCIINYIDDRTFSRINLVRRIENPYYSGVVIWQ